MSLQKWHTIRWHSNNRKILISLCAKFGKYSTKYNVKIKKVTKSWYSDAVLTIWQFLTVISFMILLKVIPKDYFMTVWYGLGWVKILQKNCKKHLFNPQCSYRGGLFSIKTSIFTTAIATDHLILTSFERFMSLKTLITMVLSVSFGLALLLAPRVLKTDRIFLRPKS